MLLVDVARGRGRKVRCERSLGALARSLAEVLVDLGLRPPRGPVRSDRTYLIAADAGDSLACEQAGRGRTFPMDLLVPSGPIPRALPHVPRPARTLLGRSRSTRTGGQQDRREGSSAS